MADDERFRESEHPENENREKAREVTLFGGSRFGKWLDNFWYHYKFQTLVTLFILAAVIFCVVTCIGRGPEAECYLCYAGKKSLTPTTESCPADAISETLAGYTDASIGVKSYLIDPDSDITAVKQASLENVGHLNDELELADSYLYLLDEDLFFAYTTLASGDHFMVPVSGYLPENTTAEVTEDGYGVYLRSLPVRNKAGFSELPGDTVICLRVAFKLGGRSDYSVPEALFRDLLSEAR